MVIATQENSSAQIIASTIDDVVGKLRASLQKEGADMEVSIDDEESIINVSLVRNRIICEACIQPEKLVRTMLTNALRANPEASALKYKIEAHNWAL
ncbi:MAG: hypothetical protein ABIQ66_02055 [Novosphingobium sp.]